ncbi:MAG TPA: TRAP transporter fused permease subunit [Usitatibacteraceae bacterium]|nr:TRAP transporter fused permease subunit [Usitatibacteraceae bacterium]
MTQPAAPQDDLLPDDGLAELSEEQRHKVEEFIEEEEGSFNRYKGWLAAFLTAVAVVTSVFHLYSAYAIVRTDLLRGVHVGLVLFLSFMLFPVARRFRHRLMWFDVLLALLSVAVIAYMLAGGDDFTDRNTMPNTWDMVFGVALIALVIEATRRTSGWIMPIVIAFFIAYAFAGPWLPEPWTHRGYDVSRLVGHMYMTLEGIFGTAVDVSATLIILFTIYGAFLQYSGAGKFFLDFSFSLMGGKSSSAGRAVVMSSFLLGGPSGSGVATTVTIGSVAYPMLAKSGYEAAAAGGLLAAGGLGAILSPPVLGAAAFLIAEFLKISYLEVIKMAVIPTILYYFCLFFMVELDARKYGMSQATFEMVETAWTLAKRYWYHFLSLASIVVFMMWGFSPTLSVFWATVTAFAVSFFHRETALYPRRFIKAMETGTTGVLNVAATCASAGIIVGVVTLTGLGLKFSSIVIEYAGGSLALTAVYTALIVWIVGLAVPVTASYIICAVIAAPALITLGVPDFAAHMFIFYYALLSEVSPPTALSCFAAAAITGADPYKTTLQAWKYTMPAFVVPFFFVLDPMGTGVLLQLPAGASWAEVSWVVFLIFVAIAALAAGLQGWLLKKTNLLERALLVVAGALVIVPVASLDAVGVGMFASVFVIQMLRHRREPAPT